MEELYITKILLTIFGVLTAGLVIVAATIFLLKRRTRNKTTALTNKP